MYFLRVGTRHLHSLKTKTKEEMRDYVKVFPQIVRDLTECDEFSDIPQTNKWIGKVLNYNVPHGNNSKTMTVPLSYQALEDPGKFTPETQFLSNILGWCLELNQVALLMQDDMLDAAITRRKRPCWYKLEEVGMRAVNDALLLEVGVYMIIKKYFSQDPSYVKYMEAFLESTYKCGMVQALEGVTVKEGRSNINAFSMDRYNKIVKYKSEHYSFLLPATLAMHLAKKYDPVIYEQVKPALEGFGWLLQANNDFSDVYGDPAYTGYVGTDIKDGACTWVICAAVERASLSQRNILHANYGKDNPDNIQAVKQVYDELNMRAVYEECETQKLKSIRHRIDQISKGFPYKRFLEFLEAYATQSNWKDIEWWFS